MRKGFVMPTMLSAGSNGAARVRVPSVCDGRRCGRPLPHWWHVDSAYFRLAPGAHAARAVPGGFRGCLHRLARRSGPGARRGRRARVGRRVRPRGAARGGAGADAPRPARADRAHDGRLDVGESRRGGASGPVRRHAHPFPARGDGSGGDRCAGRGCRRPHLPDALPGAGPRAPVAVGSAPGWAGRPARSPAAFPPGGAGGGLAPGARGSGGPAGGW